MKVGRSRQTILKLSFPQFLSLPLLLFGRGGDPAFPSLRRKRQMDSR
jgi:hypothetical protein